MTVDSILPNEVKLDTKKRKKELGSLAIASNSAVSISSPIPTKIKISRFIDNEICLSVHKLKYGP